MSSSRYDQMFKFISQYKYEISENVSDNLKCGKCKNILINVYSVPCGCLYCCDCVNEMLNNGVENCPGKTEDCRDVLISNNHIDLRRNREISNVVMKCPEEMCLYECTILNMEDHLRVCEMKSAKCPFSNDGCDVKKIARERLNDHCQSANFNHCKILMEMIDNMRNEIDMLKANDKKNLLKIENLEKNLKSKDEIKIDKIDLIKLIKETVKQDCFIENLESKIEDKINDKMNNRVNESRKKIEKDEEIFAEIQKEKQDRIKSINEIKMETNKKSEMMETKINNLKKSIDEIRFNWRIDKLDEKRDNDEYICSEYFTRMIKPYNLRLLFWANGTGDTKGKGCSIYLLIYPGGNDQLLSWPFTADVTMKVMSKTNPNINKSITEYCKINKPINNQYNSSESFNFLYRDFRKNRDMLENGFIIECIIDFK